TPSGLLQMPTGASQGQQLLTRADIPELDGFAPVISRNQPTSIRGESNGRGAGEVSVEGVNQLALCGIEQQNLTTATGCSHQFAIRRNRQSLFGKSSWNMPGHQVWAGQIEECDFLP